MLPTLHTRTKLALFLVPAITAVVFLAWWFNPERVIQRRLDALLGIIDVSLLRTGSNAQMENALRALVADPVEFAAPPPIPDGPRTPTEVAASLRQLHDSVTSCTIQRTAPTIHFPVSGEARLETNLQADLAAGGGVRTTRRYHAEILYKKGPGGWKIHRIALRNL